MSTDPSQPPRLDASQSAPAYSVGGWGQPDGMPEVASTRYELRNLLGQGGMGRVWVAWDHHLQREVALKELHPDQVDAARLRQEAALTARLDHPSIVAVYDIGELPDGRPFYTMRLVRGHPLEERLRRTPADAENRGLLRVLLSVCEAVAAAHRAGVVHRDLKPANVLLGQAGEVQVVDWGLAAALSRSSGTTGPVGTPRWMSPEQAHGAAPTRASDVWSLGAMLYAVVAGRSPYEGDADAQMKGREQGPPPSIMEVAPSTPSALATLVQRALAHDPADRYPTAVELSEDLARYLDGRLVQAHDYSPLELIRHAVWTARLPLAILTVLVGSGLAATIVTFEGVRAERDRALLAEDVADRARESAEDHLASARLQQAIGAALGGERRRAEDLASQVLAVRRDPSAIGILAGFSHAPLPDLVSEYPTPGCEIVALSSDAGLFACAQADQTQLIDVGSGEVQRTLDGRALRLAFAVDDERLEVWDTPYQGHTVSVATGEALTTTGWPGWPVASTGPLALALEDYPPSEPVPLPCFAQFMVADRAGQRVATVCSGGRVLVGPPSKPGAMDVQTELVGRVHPSAAAFSPSGRWLALGTLRGGAAALDLQTGAVHHSGLDLDRGIVETMAISPDDRLVALVRDSGDVAIWNLQTGAWLAELEAAVGSAVAFVSASELVVVGEAVQRWDLSGLGPSHVLHMATGVAEVAVDRDARHAYIGLSTGAVERLDVRTGVLERVVPASEDTVKALASLPDGGVIATRMRPGDVLAATHRGVEPLWHEGFRRLVRLHDGRLLAAGVGTRLLEQHPGGPFEEVRSTRRVDDLEASPDGRSAVGVEVGEVLHVWRTEAGFSARVLEPRGGSAAIRDDGLIARSTPDGVRLEDLHGGVVAELEFDGRPLDLRFSVDGRWLAASSHEGPIHVWRVSDHELVAVLIGHEERVDNVAFSPDGTWMVSGGWDHQVRIWDLTGLPVDGDRVGR